MTKGHWLRGLQMRKAGHDGGVFFVGQFNQAGEQALQFCTNGVYFVTQVQTHIGGHLIIT